MNIIEILDQVKQEVGMSSEIELFRNGDKYVYNDGYIFILASDKDDIEFWASAHKLIVAKLYKLIKLGSGKNSFKPKNEYEKIVAKSLKLCHREPEIDIFFSKKYDNISVVAYTDDTNMIIKENNALKRVA